MVFLKIISKKDIEAWSISLKYCGYSGSYLGGLDPEKKRPEGKGRFSAFTAEGDLSLTYEGMFKEDALEGQNQIFTKDAVYTLIGTFKSGALTGLGWQLTQIMDPPNMKIRYGHFEPLRDDNGDSSTQSCCVGIYIEIDLGDKKLTTKRADAKGIVEGLVATYGFKKMESRIPALTQELVCEDSGESLSSILITLQTIYKKMAETALTYMNDHNFKPTPSPDELGIVINRNGEPCNVTEFIWECYELLTVLQGSEVGIGLESEIKESWDTLCQTYNHANTLQDGQDIVAHVQTEIQGILDRLLPSEIEILCRKITN